MIKVNSTVKLNFPKIQQLTQAQVEALEADRRSLAHRSYTGTGFSAGYRCAAE